MKSKKKSKQQTVCERLAKRKRMNYIQAERALEEYGFRLREYGGMKKAYAIFTHKETGLVVNVEYDWRHVRAASYVADRITAFYWYVDPETVAQYN